MRSRGGLEHAFYSNTSSILFEPELFDTEPFEPEPFELEPFDIARSEGEREGTLRAPLRGNFRYAGQFSQAVVC